MIKRTRLFGTKTRITFSLPKDAPAGTVSVVGCFNNWEPGRHELIHRKDGTRTVTVQLEPGRYRFRYLATGGVWLDDEHADHVDQDGSQLILG
ncbi:isoamylase early set domain-containing protein [Micromonospora sp. CPCC 205371]|nr:isoamylase early set domain-containing protein [Micromonospora sp. CPCC 205371]